MAQYYYDGHGNRHKLLSEKEKNDEDSARGIGFLVLLCLFVFLVNAPGTLIISLFANSIETTTSAWIWSLVADTVLFFTIYILLKRWMWTFILYAVLSIISAVIIFMNTDNRNIDKTMDNLYFFYTSENHSSIEKPDDAIWKDFFIAEQITTPPTNSTTENRYNIRNSTATVLQKKRSETVNHSNHTAGKSRYFLKNGQDLRSRIRTGI